MFSLKHLAGLVLTSLLFVSCAPFPPDHGSQPQVPNAETVPNSTGVNTPKTPEELKKEEEKRKAREKANREAKERRERLQKKKEEEAANNPNLTNPDKKEPVRPPSKFRTAVAIPGKPGFVFNPWTNKAVDVRGVPGGTLVRDPNDGNPDHKFRVP